MGLWESVLALLAIWGIYCVASGISDLVEALDELRAAIEQLDVGTE